MPKRRKCVSDKLCVTTSNQPGSTDNRKDVSHEESGFCILITISYYDISNVVLRVNFADRYLEKTCYQKRMDLNINNVHIL